MLFERIVIAVDKAAASAAMGACSVDNDPYHDVVTANSVTGEVYVMFNLPPCPVGSYRPGASPCAP